MPQINVYSLERVNKCALVPVTLASCICWCSYWKRIVTLLASQGESCFLEISASIPVSVTTGNAEAS